MVHAEVQALMYYANSHVGLCLWPSKVGHPHASLKGRDFFREIVEECRRQRIHPIGYFSLIYDNWNFENHHKNLLIDIDVSIIAKTPFPLTNPTGASYLSWDIQKLTESQM